MPNEYCNASLPLKDSPATRYPSNPSVMRVPFFVIFSFSQTRKGKMATIGVPRTQPEYGCLNPKP